MSRFIIRILIMGVLIAFGQSINAQNFKSFNRKVTKQRTEQSNQSSSSSVKSTSSTHNHSHSSKSNDGPVKTWRVDNPMGGYTEFAQYANGSTTSHTVQKCMLCHGSKVCSVCFGKKGTYNAYTGIYYPCGSCLQSGNCKYCNGTGTQHFYTTTDATGNTIGIANDNMGPTYISGGSGSSSSSSSNASSGSGSGTTTNSSRYGKRTCPQCYGSGKCATCGGDGIADSYYTGGSMACPNCSNGKCRKCNGTGSVYGLK